MISRLTGAVALTIIPLATIVTSHSDELLLLRNGYALRGQVSRVGDRYIVRIASGSETRIPVSAVELLCRDLQDAYRQKAERVGLDRSSDRIELFDWCLRHELYDRADEQLDSLERTDPRNPHLPQLRLRLELLSASTAVPSRAPSALVRLNADELELFMRGLPAASVEQFTTTVQPLLLNRCSTGGCHGSRSANAFRLVRPRFGRELERPFTQRNLHAVLKTINPEGRLSISFVEALGRPHGPDNLADPNLSKSQIEQVKAWLKQLTKPNSRERPGTISSTSPTLLQASTSGGGKFAKGPPKHSADSSRAREPSQSPRQRDDPGQQDDPFDPEVFNRRFHAANASKSPPRAVARPRNDQPAAFNTPNRRR